MERAVQIVDETKLVEEAAEERKNGKHVPSDKNKTSHHAKDKGI